MGTSAVQADDQLLHCIGGISIAYSIVISPSDTLSITAPSLSTPPTKQILITVLLQELNCMRPLNSNTLLLSRSYDSNRHRRPTTQDPFECFSICPYADLVCHVRLNNLQTVKATYLVLPACLFLNQISAWMFGMFLTPMVVFFGRPC